MFLESLISLLKTTSDFRLDSEAEIADLIDYVSRLETKIWQLVSNQSGSIVRLVPRGSPQLAIQELLFKFGDQETRTSLSSVPEVKICETLGYGQIDTSSPGEFGTPGLIPESRPTE